MFFDTDQFPSLISIRMCLYCKTRAMKNYKILFFLITKQTHKLNQHITYNIYLQNALKEYNFYVYLSYNSVQQ